MTISLRLSDRDSDLIRHYADIHGMTVSDVVRQSVLSRIEDEFDLEAYDRALAAYHANPVTYSHSDVRKMLELDE